MDSTQYVPFAGGTDFMVKYRRYSGLQVKTENPLIFISQIPELNFIDVNNGLISIGSAVTFTQLLNHKDLFPAAFIKSCQEIASVAIRNVATIGGNICNASPAADILPALYCLDAELVIKSLRSERIVPITQFFTGPGKTVIKRDELLTEIRFKKSHFNIESFRKIGTRKANALSKISFCGMASITNHIIDSIGLSFGAVAPTVIRSVELEKQLLGKTAAQIEKEIDFVLSNYEKRLKPIDDQRSNAKYRKQVALNLLKEFLLKDLWPS